MKRNIHQLIANKVRPIELAAFLKKILLIKRKYFNINGKYWFLDPVSNFGYRLLKDKYYEPQMTTQILEILQEGDIFIDLGGNEGYFSILASFKVGNKGRVYCIEPQNRLWEIILRNANKNNCYNIKIVPFAIADKIEEVTISLSPSINTGSSTFVSEKRRLFWETQKINCTTLDCLFSVEQFTTIKLIKIDIEGYEYLALKGGRTLLENQVIKNIIIEFHSLQLEKLGQSTDDVIHFLNHYGYVEVNGIYTCVKD
jgi:FkbM family methyltransferase